MKRFKANQKLLFKAETVFNLKPLEKYEIIFSFLGTSPLEILYPSTGRPPIPYGALLKALVYKNIKNISYLSDLVRELQDNPDLALVFGFHPLHLPCVENFSAFLGDTENSIFQEVRDSLVSKLIELKEIKGTYLTFDSSNIPVKVKENNLKTSIKDRFTKTKEPKGDPESRLSVMVHFPKPFQKEFKYFWGFCMQNPSVRGLRAISNHCTIAHITVLLVALTAAKTGNKDKISFVKSFLPSI